MVCTPVNSDSVNSICGLHSVESLCLQVTFCNQNKLNCYTCAECTKEGVVDTWVWPAAKCILQWAELRDNCSCPQCKKPFTRLLTYRTLDGTMSDFPVEESVCLLKRATWIQDQLKVSHMTLVPRAFTKSKVLQLTLQHYIVAKQHVLPIALQDLSTHSLLRQAHVIPYSMLGRF